MKAATKEILARQAAVATGGGGGWYAKERSPPSFPSFPPGSAKRRLCQSENPLFLFLGRLAQLVERLVYTE